ncbi:Hint domain-containing protein [Hyphococcus luteus]|uniref:Hint domain-containing protein n=1 Tax=Hyphococcus luteus TaxID=2058213 RepID=A0A2S7K4W1_9PROT|nr:Hint domain-containing protein [Marinicaulis flavus]PQA87547.1 hypothetical protein CW354_12170 [Marinicaulis flavus]
MSDCYDKIITLEDSTDDLLNCPREVFGDLSNAASKVQKNVLGLSVDNLIVLAEAAVKFTTVVLPSGRIVRFGEKVLIAGKTLDFATEEEQAELGAWLMSRDEAERLQSDYPDIFGNQDIDAVRALIAWTDPVVFDAAEAAWDEQYEEASQDPVDSDNLFPVDFSIQSYLKVDGSSAFMVVITDDSGNRAYVAPFGDARALLFDSEDDAENWIASLNDGDRFNVTNSFDGLDGAQTAELQYASSYSGGDTAIRGELPPNYASCFLAGTQILLANGKKVPIEKVVPGDEIFAFDAKEDAGRGDLVPCRVEAVYRGESEAVLSFNDVNVTKGHLFLDINGGFRPLAKILEDERPM